MILRTIIIALFFSTFFVKAEQVSIAWQKSPEPSVAGYRVYLRTAHEVTPKVIDVGYETTASLRNLEAESKYFCRVTSYTFFGEESLPSEEVSFFTAPKTPTFDNTSDGLQMSLSGKPGGTIDLYESEDMKTWTYVRTIINTDGALDISQYTNLSGTRKFYRLGYRGESIEGWMASRGLSDPNADFQGSNISNRLAYSYGLDLTGKQETTRPTMGRVDAPWQGTTEKFATFSFTIRESTRDVKPIVESSYDLRYWFETTPSMHELASSLNGNGTRSITLRDARPISENSHRQCYYRLNFETKDEEKLLTYDDWLSLYEGADPNGDLDHDGISNAYTFATGADLLTETTNAHPKLGFQATPEGNCATLTYRLRDSIQGVVPRVEYSENLKNWIPAEDMTTEISNIRNYDGTRSITIQENETTSPETNGYYRVKYQFLETR